MNWIDFTLFCKRTNYPKLGYIIHRLKAEGIACRFNGRSHHADHILEVDETRLADANAILDERIGRYPLDEVRDDLPRFYPYSKELPSHEAVDR